MKDLRNSDGDQWSPNCTTFSDPPHPADSLAVAIPQPLGSTPPCPVPAQPFLHTVLSWIIPEVDRSTRDLEALPLYGINTMHETCHLVTCRATSARHTYDSCLYRQRVCEVHRLNNLQLICTEEQK